MAANLLVIQGVDSGLRFDLTSESVSLGRGIHNDLRLGDAEVSRLHVRINRTANGFELADQSSANGTLVNGRAVSTHRLRTGDQIQIGRTVVVFDAGEDEDSGSLQANAGIRFVDAENDDQSRIVHRIAPDDTRTYVRPDQTVVHAGTPEHLSGLQALYRISEEAANTTASQEQLLQNILDLTLAATEADRGCVLLIDSQTDRMAPASYRERTGGAASGPMTISRTIVNYVATERQGVRTSDAQSDRRFASGNSIIVSGIREAICVPMMGLADLIGVIYVDTTSQTDDLVERFDEHRHALTDDHLKLVLAIGRQAALAVERRLYQQALLKAERFAAVGQTITMLSHHVKNILQGVRGGSYLIETGLSQGDEDVIRQGWGIVDRNQNRIYNLVMDMLTYSTEKKPVLGRAQLNDVVREVCDLMNGVAAEYSVDLIWEPAEALPESAFDAEGIHRAVLNIVTNAIEAVEGMPDASVRVQTALSPNRALVVSVRDNGPGIPEEHRQALFSLFESTKGSRGTGIGLAVSRKIVQEHGGRIEVESSSDQGTVFRILLPVLEDPAEVESDSGTRTG